MSEHKIGSMVKVRLGGQCHDAQVTDGPHKLSGHIEAKLKVGSKTMKTRFDPKTEVKPIAEEAESVDEMGYGQARRADYDFADSVPAQKQVTKKFLLKTKAGKLVSTHSNALDAVRAREKIGDFNTHSIVKEEVEEIEEINEELEKKYPIGTKLRLKGNLKNVSSLGVNKQMYPGQAQKERWAVSQSSKSLFTGTNDSRDHGQVVGYHGDNIVVKSNHKSYGTDNQKHVIARPEHVRGVVGESTEHISELSIDTVKSYKAKVATNPTPSKTTPDILHKAIRRFAGKERAEDRIHHDEMIKMRSRLGIKEEVLDEGRFIETHKGEDDDKIMGESVDKKEAKIKQLRQDYKDKIRWSKESHNPAEQRQHQWGADKIKNHLKNQYKVDVNEESLGEVIKTEKPKHKVGDTVWATSPTNKALTMTGKVTKIGRTLTTIKHKDGSEAHYPHKLVGKEYSDLHSDPAKKYKQFQREHLEQTGELLTLSEVKYMVENANGGAGAIAQHAGIDGKAPEGTGKVKKMMGNKISVDAIVKIIAKGAKPN